MYIIFQIAVIGISDYFANEGQGRIIKLYVFSSQIFVFERIPVTADRNDGHKGKTKKTKERDPSKDEGKSRGIKLWRERDLALN